MKKQNFVKKLLTIPSILSILAGLAIGFSPLPTALAAGTCYMSSAPLQVSPTTSTCATDPSGRTSFKNTAGAVVQPTDPAACYVGTSSGSGSFVTISYVQQTCANLETLRLAGIEAQCTASGGTVKHEGTADHPTTSCTCPSGQTYSNFICTTTPAPSGNGGGTTSPGPKNSDCTGADATANGCCLSTDLTSENCGIVKYLNIAFNFISGGVTLAIIGNIVFAGIQYSTAQGDPSGVGKAKKRIRDAIIAFIMFLSLYAFIQWLIPGGVF